MRIHFLIFSSAHTHTHPPRCWLHFVAQDKQKFSEKSSGGGRHARREKPWRYLIAQIKNRNKKKGVGPWEVNLVREKEDHALFLSTHTGLEGWREGNDLSIFSPSLLFCIRLGLLVTSSSQTVRVVAGGVRAHRCVRSPDRFFVFCFLFLFSEAAAICCSLGII